MLVKTIKEVRNIIKQNKLREKTVGLVPTMGYLHEGHLSLIRKAKQDNDFVIVSIFVNPIQFGPNEDFEDYPRDLDRDYKLAIEAGADLIFNPSVEEMYPQEIKTFVEVQDLTENLCGLSRPGHFRGVTTVVAKLFNIVQPDKAYFGKKDAQQVSVISKMVQDLNFDLEIVPCPIVRENDGLAMSSRNVYLKAMERKSALLLSQSLFQAQELINKGERNAQNIKDFITATLQKDEKCDIDYVKIVDFDTLKDIEILKGNVLVALAVKIGKTRLIDNIIMEVK
ncbi:MAG: pantoate--beta-alanine ligase [Clostridia bacterium]|jgi:pantoate--beta-alanine ligase|nr:pantoate--beta-alanine ligase [Clostridia bacterium]